MAHSFRFETSIGDGLYTYRYVAEEGGLFEHRWAALPEGWAEPGQTPWHEFAVNPTWREEVAIYLGLIWRLTQGLMLYGVPRYWRGAGMRAAGEPYALVDWEYEVESSTHGDPGLIRGFVPARSCVQPAPRPTPWTRENEGRAGLFQMPVFGVFRDVLKALDRDQTSELNVFALQCQSNAEGLVRTLQGPQHPQLTDCLAAGEIFIDLVMSNEHGYSDVIVLQAPSSLDEKLAPIIKEYEAAIEAFEAEADKISSGHEFVESMTRLLSLGDENARSRWTDWTWD